MAWRLSNLPVSHCAQVRNLSSRRSIKIPTRSVRPRPGEARPWGQSLSPPPHAHLEPTLNILTKPQARPSFPAHQRGMESLLEISWELQKRVFHHVKSVQPSFVSPSKPPSSPSQAPPTHTQHPLSPLLFLSKPGCPKLTSAQSQLPASSIVTRRPTTTQFKAQEAFKGKNPAFSGTCLQGSPCRQPM